MQLYQVKIRYDVNTSTLTQSQSTQYRIKPKQFKRDDIVIFDIPVSEFPFRIPGTHIGIRTPQALNPNRTLNKEHLDLLDCLVTTTMQELNLRLKSDGKQDFVDYDAVPLPCEQFSHRQNLQVINELVRLRRAIRSASGFKEEWVEVLQQAYRAVNVSGYGYHRDEEQKRLAADYNQLALSDNGQPREASGRAHDEYQLQEGQNSAHRGFLYLSQGHLLSQRPSYYKIEEQNTASAASQQNQQPAYNGSENAFGDAGDDFEHSGVRPAREFDPEKPRSPMRYADHQQMQLDRLAQMAQSEQQRPKSAVRIPRVDPDDKKFEHIQKKYDAYYGAARSSSARRPQRAEYESAYRQDKVRGEIVHYERAFPRINREMVIGANECAEDDRLAFLASRDDRDGVPDAAFSAQMQRRILAQRYAKQALDGDEGAYKKLRGLAERAAAAQNADDTNSDADADVEGRVRQEVIDHGAEERDLDFMKASRIRPLSPRTRHALVDELVNRVQSALYDTAPEVATGRPKTARKVYGATNYRMGDDEEFDEYDNISLHSGGSRPQSASADFQRYKGAADAAECVEEGEQDVQEEDVAEEEQGDDSHDWHVAHSTHAVQPKHSAGADYSLEYSRKHQAESTKNQLSDSQNAANALRISSTLTQKLENPPQPYRRARQIGQQDIVFGRTGFHIGSQGCSGGAGYTIRLPSVSREFKDRALADAASVAQVEVQLQNSQIDKSAVEYARDFVCIADRIFEQMMQAGLYDKLAETENRAYAHVGGVAENE